MSRRQQRTKRYTAEPNAQRACLGKVRHPSPQAAAIELAKCGRKYGDLGLVFYRCAHCGGYHIGHAPKSDRKRLRTQRLLKLIESANQKTGGAA